MASKAIRIAVTGQACLHGEIAWADAAAQEVRASLSDADAALVNLEATVATPGAWPTKTRTLHIADPAALASLRQLGFGVLGLANNHAFDLGPPGIAETLRTAALAALQTTGAGNNISQAAAPAIIQSPQGRIAVIALDTGPQPEIVYATSDRAGINGVRMQSVLEIPDSTHATLTDILKQTGQIERDNRRIAVGYQSAPEGQDLSFFGTPIRRGNEVTQKLAPHPEDMEQVRRSLEDLNGQADCIVAMVHGHLWDADWTATPGWFLDLAHALIDLGAHVVAGTGAPVLQPIQFYRGRPIFSGLGNFVFHTGRADIYDRLGIPVWDGAIATCHFTPGTSECAVEILPIQAGRPTGSATGPAPAPQAAGPKDSQRIFAHLTSGLFDSERAKVRLASVHS